MKNNEQLSEQEVKMRKKYKIELLVCLICAVLVEGYFIGLNAINTSVQNFNIYVKISYMVFILMAIVMLEIAYKKEKKQFVVAGVEFIALAIHMLLIEKSANVLSTSYIWLIYYCLKAIIIYTKENKRRLKQISDISEIVKEEKPTKKVAKKRKT